MSNWNYRWVCPHWEFFLSEEEAPDKPFSERSRESAATFLDILNVNNYNVKVRVDFYSQEGVRDDRFSFDGFVAAEKVWAYRTDTGLHFPRPDPGQTVSAVG